MAHSGQEITGPDLKLRVVRIEPEVLEMEATYGGAGWLPPEHFHPSQSERFEVLDGAMRTIIGGVERRYEAGETFEVPAGIPHQMTADGPTRTRWEVRPALRTAQFFERLYGDGPDSAQRAESIVDFLAEFSDEVRFTDG